MREKTAVSILLAVWLALAPAAARADGTTPAAAPDAQLDCVRRLSGNFTRVARGSFAERDLRIVCLNNPPESELSCLGDYLRADSYLRTAPGYADHLCVSPEARACYDGYRRGSAFGGETSYGLCSRYGGDSWQRDCVAKYLRRGTFGGKSLDDQIFDSDIVCKVEKDEPELVGCMIRLRKGLTGTDGSHSCWSAKPAEKACYRRLAGAATFDPDGTPALELRAVCQRGLSDADLDCAAGYIRKGGVFASDPYRAAYYCSPEGRDTRACFDDLSARHIFKNVAETDKVCDSLKDPQQRQCMADYTANRILKGFDDRLTVCSILSKGGRDCVANLVVQGKLLSVRDALSACSYRSSDTRDCIVDFYNRSRAGAPAGAASALFADGTVTGFADAEKVCEVDNRADRACVVRTMRGKHSSASDAVRECMRNSSQRDSCRRYVSDDLGIIDWETVCDVPNFEVRACLYDKFEAKLREPVPFWQSGPRQIPPASEFLDECLAEFIQNLTLPLDGIAHGAGCRFAQ